MDERLIRQALDGDPSAFAALIERHALRAYRIAYVIAGNHHDAEDAVQEACLTAYRTLGTLRDPQAFAAWFGQIAANRARDIVRRSAAQRERDGAVDGPPPPPRPEDEVERISLREAIARLPDPHRAVVMLHYGGDMSSAQVAAALGRPPGTVRRLLTESYIRLRRYLGGTFDERQAAQ